MSEARAGPIGIFDSGVGGLSVWRELAALLPEEDTVYVADQRHVPYGGRSVETIRDLCEAIVSFLLEQRCKAVVLACNTASAAALYELRERHPELPAFGMEPAVKPAASTTRTGVVGILATPATFQGRLFKTTSLRWASTHRLITEVCAGLVEQVEAGYLEHAETDALLERSLEPMLTAGADTIVLACTHYSFLTPAIRRLAGPDVEVIDPAPAVARHVRSRLGEIGLLAGRSRGGRHRFLTTGDPGPMTRMLTNVTGGVGRAEHVAWDRIAGAPPRRARREGRAAARD